MDGVPKHLRIYNTKAKTHRIGRWFSVYPHKFSALREGERDGWMDGWMGGWVDGWMIERYGSER